jgi:hypothetical protein
MAPTCNIVGAMSVLRRNSFLHQRCARYGQALHALCVKDRDDPLTEMIARMIIKIAQSGIHDAVQLSALAITEREIC